MQLSALIDHLSQAFLLTHLFNEGICIHEAGYGSDEKWMDDVAYGCVSRKSSRSKGFRRF
jgi:hypothetical protein